VSYIARAPINCLKQQKVTANSSGKGGPVSYLDAVRLSLEGGLR